MSAQDDPPAGGFDFGSLLSQLGQMQHNIEQAQQEVAAEEVVGTSGGGTVKVTVTGAMEVVSVRIDPSVLDPTEVEMIEDLVLAAVRDGLEKAAGLAGQALRGAALPGMDPAGLGGLIGGLLGAAADDE